MGAGEGRWYIIAAYREDYVFDDAFIEALPRDSNVPGAKLRSWVAEASAGVGWRSNRFAAEYRYVVHGHEYDAQPSAHAYGAIAVSIIGR